MKKKEDLKTCEALQFVKNERVVIIEWDKFEIKLIFYLLIKNFRERLKIREFFILDF